MDFPARVRAPSTAPSSPCSSPEEPCSPLAQDCGPLPAVPRRSSPPLAADGLRPRSAAWPGIAGTEGAAVATAGTSDTTATGLATAHGKQPGLSDAAWERIAQLPAAQRLRLNASERATVAGVVRELRRHVEAAGIDFVPVFGHWSLRTDNYRELGRASQADVQEGRDTLPARISGYGLDFVASTEYRGRPQHPGAVASIAPLAGGQVAGTVLKLPFDRAEELLSVLLVREICAEADLRSPPDADGRPRSSLMYRPAVRPVTLGDGSTLHALLFETHPEGPKSLRRVFGDAAGLTAERLAFFIAAEGGFVRDGKAFGGASADYWKAGMQRLVDSGDTPDPLLAEAFRLAAESRGADGTLSLDALAGAAVPRGTWHGHGDWLASAEARLPHVYARPAGADALAGHRRLQGAMDAALADWQAGEAAQTARAGGADLRAALAGDLPALLREAGFDPSVYAASARGADGYGRHLLFSESNARAGMQGLYSVQVAAFDARRHPAALAHPALCAVFEVPQATGGETQRGGTPDGDTTVAVYLHRDIDGVSGGLERPADDPFASAARVLH